MDKIFNLIEAFNKAKEQTDENPFMFKCPNCGSDAKGGYAEDNGHIRIVCWKCDVRIIE